MNTVILVVSLVYRTPANQGQGKQRVFSCEMQQEEGGWGPVSTRV